MATVTPNRLVTADELLAMTEWQGELLRGELHEMNPPGVRHEVIAVRIGHLLYEYAERHGGASVGGAGFLIEQDPDTVRAPDAAWLSPERATQIDSKYMPGTPDLLAEIVSPDDGHFAVHDKALMWLTYGCRLVLVADPAAGTVTRYRALDDIVAFTGAQVVDCSPVAPGFAPTAARLLGG